jgi:hypothetical protein
MKPTTSVVISSNIKRVNAFEGYIEIIEKRVRKRDIRASHKSPVMSTTHLDSINEEY